MKRVCQSRYAFSPEREKKLPYEGKQHAVHSAENGHSTSSRNRLCSDPLSQYEKVLKKLNDSSWSLHSMTFPG
jgi:hypothetical protein